MNAAPLKAKSDRRLIGAAGVDGAVLDKSVGRDVDAAEGGGRGGDLGDAPRAWKAPIARQASRRSRIRHGRMIAPPLPISGRSC